MTVAALAQMYLAHAAKEFNGQHGHKEVATIRHAFAPLITLYGQVHPSEIQPLRLRAARQFWIEQGRARSTIQARMQRLRKAWRWGRQVGLIEIDLPDIGTLRYGHAPEPEAVKPVDLALVEMTLPHLSKGARSLIKLIMYTGMRPGEACGLSVDALDTTCNPWVYRPKHHKTAWKGCKREIFLGPKAQMLLAASVCKAAAAKTQNALGATSAGCIATAIPNAIGKTTTTIFLTQRDAPWKTTSLYMSVFNACRRHGLPHWHPNQIRHTVATMLRKECGLDSAQAVLGHSKIETTQHYAVRQNQLASEAAIRYG